MSSSSIEEANSAAVDLTPSRVKPTREGDAKSIVGAGRQRLPELWWRLQCWVARVVGNQRRVRLYRAFTLIRVGWAYLYDARRFARSAHLTNPFKDRAAASAHLLRAAHGLEKGQALPEPRPGFGGEKIQDLLKDTARYQAVFGCDDVSLAVVGVLRGMQRFHARTGHAREEWEVALSSLEEAEFRAGRSSEGIGCLPLTRSEVLAALPADPEAFFRRRCSIRQFDPGPIDPETLKRAVMLAQKTPSVCNRQSGRVYIYTDPDEMRAVLKHQDGNKGFGHEAAAVMVITSDLRCFYKEGERNQGFVDGGMFAMSLVYALHSLGLGSCLLNWNHEVIITLLAAVYLRETFTVAASPRRPLTDVLVWAHCAAPVRTGDG
jgi:nitroreductase